MNQKNKQIIACIAAMDRHRVIGYQNQLPWKLPADQQWFKKVTLGKPIIMGSKTYQSIGKPLPGRKNIILTRQNHFNAPGCTVVHSIESALAEVKNNEEVMIIGGAKIYEAFMPYINKMYLTFIDHDFEGDAYFPEWDESEWKSVEEILNDPDDKNPYSFRFMVFDRIT